MSERGNSAMAEQDEEKSMYVRLPIEDQTMRGDMFIDPRKVESVFSLSSRAGEKFSWVYMSSGKSWRVSLKAATVLDLLNIASLLAVSTSERKEKEA